MGQRSQIYVKVDDTLIIANYYQWNYAERMISRARYGIERIKYYIDKGYMWAFTDKHYILQLSRMFDVNFDYKDVVISVDIMKEYNEYGDNSDYKDYIFNYENNDGQLYIWIDTKNKTLKYALTDSLGEVPMTCDDYMEWEDQTCYEPYTDRFTKSELRTYERNKKYIEKSADLMTSDELYDFKCIEMNI